MQYILFQYTHCVLEFQEIQGVSGVQCPTTHPIYLLQLSEKVTASSRCRFLKSSFDDFETWVDILFDLVTCRSRHSDGSSCLGDITPPSGSQDRCLTAAEKIPRSMGRILSMTPFQRTVAVVLVMRTLAYFITDNKPHKRGRSRKRL